MPAQKTKALQRGSACLSCRKRKMKCDGHRPFCTQCVKAHREDECQFDDQHRKSRTLMLQAKVEFLEQKLRKLEAEPGPSTLRPFHSRKSSKTTSTVTSQQSPMDIIGHIHFNDLSAISSTMSLEHAGLRNSIELFEPSGPPTLDAFVNPAFDFLQPLSTNGSPLFPRINLTDHSNMGSPEGTVRYLINTPSTSNNTSSSQQSHQALLEIFWAHKHQCAFGIDATRFRCIDRHPALMNAIYLIACHFSQSPRFAELESYFFKEVLTAITEALEHSDRLTDIVSASCLVAVYHYANGHVVEGYRHAFAAVQLALFLCLHQVSSAVVTDDDSGLAVFVTPELLRDSQAVFWQVFDVDRCWSVAHGLPSALINDQTSAACVITTPRPQTHMMNLSNDGVILPNLLSLRIEAASLYERAYRLSSTFLINEQFWDDRRQLENAIDQFILMLQPLSPGQIWQDHTAQRNMELFAIRALADVACIYLQRDHVVRSIAACQKCLKSAHSVSSRARQLKERDVELLDPIISACWYTVGKLFIQLMMTSGNKSDKSQPMHDVSQELGVLVQVLKRMARAFPVAGQYAKLLETELFEKCPTS